MTPDELIERARNGALTLAQRASVHDHLSLDTPLAARELAVRVAAAWVETHDDPGLVVELIAIAEDRDAASERLREIAVRALAKATRYHGQPVRLEL